MNGRDKRSSLRCSSINLQSQYIQYKHLVSRVISYCYVGCSNAECSGALMTAVKGFAVQVEAQLQVEFEMHFLS
jgi:hypothetical protein